LRQNLEAKQAHLFLPLRLFSEDVLIKRRLLLKFVACVLAESRVQAPAKARRL
jgi:hypothetical protein